MAFVEQSDQLELTEDQRSRLLQYLEYEIDTAESERQGLIDTMIAEADAYRAEMGPPKDTPWKDACRIVIPVIASVTGSVFPRLHSTLFSVQNVFTVEDWKPELSDYAKAWEDFLQWSVDNELDLEDECTSWLQESIVHGTGVLKIWWERMEREVLSYNAEGEIVERQVEVLSNRPRVKHVPISDFYIRFPARSIKSSEWCAERMRVLWGDAKAYEYNGLWKDVDNIRGVTEIESPDYTRSQERAENTEPENVMDYEIFDIWLDFDLDGNGVTVPLWVVFHRPTLTLLSVRPNPYEHNKKPFVHYVFEPFPNRFFGIGLASSLRPIQEEITTLHRQRIDNNTLVNSKMWKVVAGSRADQSFQYAAPGLKVLVDSLDEIDGMEMGSAGMAESFQNEQLALSYAHQRAGYNDLSTSMDLGRAGGRQTATQTVAQIQEARTRFNWTLERSRKALREIAEITTDLYQQYSGEDEVSDRFAAVLGEKRGALLKEMFQLELESPVSVSLSLQVTASTSSANRVIEGQNLLAQMQMLQQHVMQYEMPLIQLIMNPQIPPGIKQYALERIEGSRLLMRRVMEVGDVRNTDAVLGDEEDLRRATETLLSPVGAVPSLGGGAGAPTPPVGPQGVEGAGGPMAGLFGLGA